MASRWFDCEDASAETTEKEQGGAARLWIAWCSAYLWLARHGWVPLLALLLALGGLWAFVEIAEEVQGADAAQFDEWVFRHLAVYDQAGGFWQESGRDLTALGGTTVITLMVTSVTLFLLLMRQWKSALFVVVAVVGGLTISLVLKDLYDRARPDLVVHQSHTMTSSFPSGHSTNAAVTYLTMAILLARLVHSARMKVYVLAVGLLIPLLVGLSRVFVGVHWPTDVIAGWLIGLSWGLFIYAMATYLQRHGAIEPEGLEETPAGPAGAEGNGGGGNGRGGVVEARQSASSVS